MANVDKEKKPAYKKAWFWILIVICLLIFVLGVSGTNSSETTSTNTVGKNTKTTKTEYKVGDIVDTSKVRITYKSCEEYTNYESYSAPKVGNKIIRVEFTFENISDSDTSLEGMECYADSEKCESYYYASDYKSPTLESISSGKKYNAVLYYEVPKEAEDIIIEYETNFWTSDKIEFKVDN